MTTNPNCLDAKVMLFEDIETDQGTVVKEGTEGWIVARMGDDFIIEISLEAPELVGGYRFETACLSADKFAITESPPDTAPEKV